MKLIVTGGTGFIGSHFLRAAVAAGHEVIALRRKGSAPRILLEENLRWIDTQLSSVPFEQMGDLSHACLVHFAAYGVSPQPCEWEEAFRYNVNDSIKMLSSAIRAGIRRAVVCGSCVEYGSSAARYEYIPPEAPLEPIGAYATSKAAQTISLAGLAREHGIRIAFLRPFTVFGEGQHPSNFWPSLRRAALNGEDFPMSEGSQVRDFMKVEDVASTFLNVAVSHPLSDEPMILNVGTGIPQTLRSFAQSQWQAAGATGKLLPGLVPMRKNEMGHYVPQINKL